MKRILILLVLLVTLTACGRRGEPAPLGADAPADNVPDIVGEYALNAEDFMHEEYGGTLIITATGKPNEYQFQWLVSGGIQEGIGKLEGNKINVTWKSVDTGAGESLSGTASYTVTVNGELYGTRTIEGVMEEPTKETAYPNPKP